MKRLDVIILRIFLCGLPVLAGIAVFNHFSGVRALYNMSGFLFAIWMVLSVYLGIRLVVSGDFRDRVLVRLTFIRERDEREVLLTGKATKTALMTSMAVLILLFCLSCFQVSFFKLPADKAIDGKTRGFSLGLNFSLFNDQGKKISEEVSDRYNVFSYNGLPLSSSTVILLLIAWQVISYNCVMKRLTR